MPELLGQRKRGRKPEALRLAIRELVAKLSPNTKAATVDVVVAPAKSPKGKPQILTVEIPKGCVLVPFELTKGKSDETARETIRNGLKDSEVNGSIHSLAFRDDDGNIGTIFYVQAKA